MERKKETRNDKRNEGKKFVIRKHILQSGQAVCYSAHSPCLSEENTSDVCPPDPPLPLSQEENIFS
jgi:hypothetical protein